MGATSLQPEGAVVAAVTAVLVSGLPPATMAAVLGSTLSGYGIGTNVVQAAVVMVLRSIQPLPPGPAAQLTARMQASYRAAYLVASAVRMQNAVNAGSTLADAMSNERRFYALHLDAQVNRGNAVKAVDRVAGNDPDELLIWVAKMDSRTSAECRAANGLTFTAAEPPLIGYPGAVHPRCRCRAELAPVGLRARSVDSAMSPALIHA